MDIKSRLRNPVFWSALLAAVAVFGEKSGLYTLPADYQTLFTLFSGVLVAMGIFVNPTTPGIKD